VEDVYDGTIYPKPAVAGKFNSFGSTDGIRIFKSAEDDLWLIMLVILELPPSMR